ncbi:AraC family transcriptional regulator [Paenibacillus sp. FSL H8-0034]|uniref:AraC family transcriptional regulator n=1 Tax=Paenibacillus sp. FSL H8-0034 TaxID=2954671 RepID=UPI0030F5497A
MVIVMHDQESKVPAVDSMLYKLEEIRLLNTEAYGRLGRSIITLHTLLLVSGGRGVCTIDGDSISMSRGTCLVLSPGVLLEAGTEEIREIQIYLITFHVYDASEPTRLQHGELPCRQVVSVPSCSRLEEIARNMIRHRQRENAWDRLKANIWFQELLLDIVQQGFLGSQPEAQEAISRTMAYMERNYREGITRETLAQIAGMNAEYYSRLFKKRNGQSPVDYLTEIRMKHAKRMLVLSNTSIREVAQSVGFNDEFYFSRKFKQNAGSAPTVYVKNYSRTKKVASLFIPYSGHLLALGVEPYISPRIKSNPITAHLPAATHVDDVNPDLDTLADAQPSLILTSEYVDPLKAERLNSIAPTITIPFFQMDWRGHFKAVSRVIGKEKQANEWLSNYETKAERARSQLKKHMGSSNKVLILVIRGGKYYVYGSRNAGAVIYGDLQLAPPEGVSGIYHFMEMTVEAITNTYEPDYLIIQNRDCADARKAAEPLKTGPWNKMKAVQKQQVYWIQDDPSSWNCYTSLSHACILDEVVEWFVSQ